MPFVFSSTGNGLEFTLHKACACTLDARWRCENAKSPYSRLYLIKSGAGTLTTRAGQTVPLQGGIAVLVPAECEFSYRCTHLEKLFFHFSVLRSDKYDIFAGMNRIFSLPLDPTEYDALEKALHARDTLGSLRLQNALFSFLIRFAELRALSFAPLPVYSQTVRAAIEHVLNNATITLRTRDVASALFLSESKLRNLFREETGIPLGRYVDDVVFMKAKQMLADKDRSIASVGAALGFCDAFYFSRRFKQKIGRTPSAFRNGIL